MDLLRGSPTAGIENKQPDKRLNREACIVDTTDEEAAQAKSRGRGSIWQATLAECPLPGCGTDFDSLSVFNPFRSASPAWFSWCQSGALFLPFALPNLGGSTRWWFRYGAGSPDSPSGGAYGIETPALMSNRTGGKTKRSAFVLAMAPRMAASEPTEALEARSPIRPPPKRARDGTDAATGF